MNEPLIGLRGVVVGASLTGGLQLWRDLRADRRERSAAVRQIYADLRLARSRLKMVAQTGRLRAGEKPDTYDLPDSSWLEHGAVAAGLVDAKTWQILVSAVMGIQSVNRLYAAIRADEQRVGLALKPEEMTEVRRISEYLEYTFSRVEALHEGRRLDERRDPPQLVVLHADTPETLRVAVQVLLPVVPPEWTITNPPVEETWTEIALSDPGWDNATERVRVCVTNPLPPEIATRVTVYRRHPQFDGL